MPTIATVKYGTYKYKSNHSTKRLQKRLIILNIINIFYRVLNNYIFIQKYIVLTYSKI